MKISQKMANYRDYPLDYDGHIPFMRRHYQCKTCKNSVIENIGTSVTSIYLKCKLVDGTIQDNGSCSFWSAFGVRPTSLIARFVFKE